MPLTMLLLAAAVLLLPSPLPRAPVIAVRLRHRWRTKPQGDVVLAWLLALAGELRGGSDTLRALRVCGARYDVAPRATRTAALGGDVPAALRADAAQTPILHAVAAAWSISDRTGAGLAGVLDNIADGHRRTAEVRRSAWSSPWRWRDRVPRRGSWDAPRVRSTGVPPGGGPGDLAGVLAGGPGLPPDGDRVEPDRPLVDHQDRARHRGRAVTWLLLAAALVLVPDVRIRPDRRAAPATAPALNVVGGLAAGLAALTLIPGPWNLVAAGAAAGLAWRFLPTDLSRPEERRALRIARELPDVIDLLAAVLRAGLTDAEAVAMVADAGDGPLAPPLARVARHRALGAPPREAWNAAAEPALSDLGLAMARHAETGSAVTIALDRVAADARRDYFSRAQAAARAAAVRAVVPLAVCFLPSFVLVGVVPIVASLVSGMDFP
ncbi:MAG: type II secretion system F family protein [Candidatus Nanopelagicales bacterium]